MAFLSQATTSCGLVSLSWGLSGACCSHHRVVYDASLQGLIGCLYTQGVSTFFHAASRRTERRLLAVAFRVEPVVIQPAPPQTRTCAMNASGSSVARVAAPLWRITVLPCMAKSDGVDDPGCGPDIGLQQLLELLPPNCLLTTTSAQPVLPCFFRITTHLLQQAEVPPDTIVQEMPP